MDNLENCSFITFGPRLVSMFVDLRFVPHAYEMHDLARVVADQVSEPRDVVSDFSVEFIAPGLA